MVYLKQMLFVLVFTNLIPLCAWAEFSEKDWERYKKEILQPLLIFSRSKEWTKAEETLWQYISDQSIPKEYKFAADQLLIRIYFLQEKYLEATVIGEEILQADSMWSMGIDGDDMTIEKRVRWRELQIYKEVRDAYLKIGKEMEAKRFEIRVRNILMRDGHEPSITEWTDLISGEYEKRRQEANKAFGDRLRQREREERDGLKEEPKQEK